MLAIRRVYKHLALPFPDSLDISVCIWLFCWGILVYLFGEVLDHVGTLTG